MVDVTRVEQVGDNLYVHLSDGTSAFAYASTPMQWIGTTLEDAGDGGDGGSGGGGGGTGGGFTLKPVPDSLQARDRQGTVYNLNRIQLTHASKMLAACIARPTSAKRDVMRIVLITAIVESAGMYMYSNVKHYPETADIPHDRDGSDSDSVGLFQQRPTAGWGTPAQCMDHAYSTYSFLGGSTGPRGGSSPRGLFDIAGWEAMTPGTAAQKVQVSAFPTRYDVVVPVADAVLDALLTESSGGGGSTGAWQWPFQYSKWVIQTGTYAVLAQFGWRVHPITGVRTFHNGLDFGAGGIAGQPIPAASAGVVREAGYNGAMGNHVWITHPGGFETRYFHMVAAPAVSTGQNVDKGTILGNVGSTGLSTGPHLHWETHVNGTPVNPRDFMKERGVPES